MQEVPFWGHVSLDEGLQLVIGDFGKLVPKQKSNILNFLYTKMIKHTNNSLI